MNSDFSIIIALIKAVVLLVGVPLAFTAQQVDKMSQDVSETEVSNFVNDAAKKWEITQEDIDHLKMRLPSQNNYVVEIEVWRLDENSEKKASITNSKKNGENGYVGYFQKDIDEGIRLYGSFKLEKDDTIKATVYNTNPTMAQPNGDITTNYASATATVY